MTQLKNANIVGVLATTNEKEKTTFSKSILSLVVALYFLGVILGAALMMYAAKQDVKLGLPVNPQMFIAFSAYIGGPTATAIGFYAWKSKAENILKIKNSNDLAQKECDASLQATLANMKGD